MAPPTKDPVELARERAELSASQRGVQAAHAPRNDPVNMEIPVRIYGSRVVALVGGVTEHSGFFNEDTDTLILFPRGAVLRLSSSVAPGDLLTLTNLKTDREVVCRVVSVKPSASAKAYVEIEFSRPMPGFWGIDFPSDTPKPSSPPPVPALTAEPKIKQQPAESPSSRSTAPILATPPPPAFKRAGVPAGPPAIAETKSREQVVEPASSPLGESKTPVTSPNAWKSSPERVISLTIVEPKGKERPVESRSSAAATPPLSASDAPGAAPTSLEGIPDVDLLLDLPTPSSESAPPAIIEPGENEQVVEWAPPVRAATAPAAASSFDRPSPVMEAALDEQDVVEPGARARRARRTLVVVCSVSLLILVGVSGVAYYRHHSKSLAETSVSPTPITTTQSGTPESLASQAQPQPIPESGALANVQGHPSTAIVTTGVKMEAKQPPEEPRVPPPASKSAAPGKTPHMPSSNLSARKLTFRAPMPAKMAASGEEPAPPVVGGELPGGVPGNQASVLGGLMPTPLPKVPSPGPVGGRVQPARLLSRVLPVYPIGAKQARIEGDVTLQADVDTAGNVVRTKVVSGPMPLHQSAMDALRQWKYEPSRLNGDPVPTQVLVVIKFRIR